MERRFDVRRREILQETEVKSQVSEGMLERLRTFSDPFVAQLKRRESKEHAQIYLAGLLSDLERKNIESIAYRHDLDRVNLQRFIGTAPWDHSPLLEELARQVGSELGESDGVIVFDPSGHKKCGRDSVGVQRQWLGRLGKVDNGQVGVYMGYASRREHALVDVRLYLPKAWDRDQARRRKCGVPKTVHHQTRHDLALEMLESTGRPLPHAWITGDDEMGRSSGFRRDLRGLGERYLLAVPSNTGIQALPEPGPATAFISVDRWRAGVAEARWTRIDVRDGEKGPLVLEIIKARVVARTERNDPDAAEELLVVTRRREADGRITYDYLLSNARSDTSLEELARVVKAEHRVEDAIKRAKSEAGLSDYEVRTWAGWHHHQTLSLMAAWFLIRETRRGKKIHPGPDGPPSSYPVGCAVASSMRPSISGLGIAVHEAQKQTPGTGPFPSL